jgi:RNA polymerase sigma factor (sigma-70 family)
VEPCPVSSSFPACPAETRLRPRDTGQPGINLARTKHVKCKSSVFLSQSVSSTDYRCDIKTDPLCEAHPRSDPSLVEATLGGDQSAFGEIVARYQSPLCALTYSSCGNIGRSEDLAQEIFVAAWRSLPALSEPARFKGWLFSIARNIINSNFRRNARDPLAFTEAIDETIQSTTEAWEPEAQVITREESEILWGVLAGFPETYREPMVLFYPQDESISAVAEALQLSEDTVRQRLSRGRVLLNDRVARLVQSGLRRSGPGELFAVGVLAALPLVAASTTAKGAIVGMAAQAGTTQTVGSAAALKSLGAMAGVLLMPAGLGAYLGYKLGKNGLN